MERPWGVFTARFVHPRKLLSPGVRCSARGVMNEPRVGRHDKAFRALMEEAGAAQALLEALLPRRFLRRVIGTPQRLSEHFVDESLRMGVADQLLRWRLRGGRAAYVYCIVEHKRSQRRLGLGQVVRYQLMLYARLHREAERSGGDLPAVVTLVVYNGERRWRGPTRFVELVRPPPELRRYVLDFEVLLLDLGATDLDKLTTHPALKGGLLALKAAAAPRHRKYALVRKALRLMKEDPSTLRSFLSYLANAVDEETAPLVEQAILSMEEGEEQMRSMIQYHEELGRRRGLRAGLKRGLSRGIEKGIEKGLERGIEKGKLEALRAAVERIIARRFKAVPADVAKKLAAADRETLERWLDAVIAAPSLRNVFH